MSVLLALDRFQGMFPDVLPHNLPEFGAEEARNCDLRGGGIRALAALPAASGILNEDGDGLKGDLTLADVFELPVAAVPTLYGSVEMMADPRTGWVNLLTTEAVYLEYVVGVGDPPRTERWDMADWGMTVTPGAIIWDQPNIFRVPYTMLGRTINFGGGPGLQFEDINNIPIQARVIGPSFQVRLTGYSHVSGYPEATMTFGLPGPLDPAILGGVALIKRNHGGSIDETVATIECIEARVPSLSAEIPCNGVDPVYYPIPATSGELIFRVNFLHDRERIRYYAAAALHEEELPSGEVAETIGPFAYADPITRISQQIIVGEGERPTLNLAWTGEPPEGCTKMRIFRSAEVAGGWRKVEDVVMGGASRTWTDEVITTEGQGVDLFGNKPPGFDATKTVLHPAGFGAALVKNVVRYTAPLALHVFPKEYQTELPEDSEATHFGLVGLGSGIVAFMAAGVYWLSGGSPASMGGRG